MGFERQFNIVKAGVRLLRKLLLRIPYFSNKTHLPTLTIMLKADFHSDLDVFLLPENSSGLSPIEEERNYFILKVADASADT